jgi:hypothetical protein
LRASACSCGGSLRERGRIDAEAFSLRGRQEGGENGMARRAAERVFQFCEGSARSLHKPFDFPISAIFLQSSCAASRQLRTSRILPVISTRSRWPILLLFPKSIILPTSQALRALRTQQAAAGLPQSNLPFPRSSIRPGRAVRHSARYGQRHQQWQQLVAIGAPGPEFKVWSKIEMCLTCNNID